MEMDHKTRACVVKTTFLGADGPSEFYFTDARDAVAFYDSCDNGDIFHQILASNCSLGALHGEAWGRFVSPVIGTEAKAVSRMEYVSADELRAIRAEMAETGYIPNISGVDE